jgi:prepilin-type N-terminal cleavage/methylation domain-containing protein
MKLPNQSSGPLKSNRGFTLIEIICVVILLGIISSIGVHLMKGTSAAGRTNALAENCYELNNAIDSIVATGATFSTAAYAVTQGTASAPATLKFPAVAATADIQSYITLLASGGGILSCGMTSSLTHSMTAASYTYTLDASSIPTFTVVAGSTQP